VGEAECLRRALRVLRPMPLVAPTKTAVGFWGCGEKRRVILGNHFEGNHFKFNFWLENRICFEFCVLKLRLTLL